MTPPRPVSNIGHSVVGACLALLILSVAVAPAADATSIRTGSCAAGSFTWTGNGDGASWGDPKNWNPSTRSPGSCSGDSVDIPIEANIRGMPAATFQDLTIDSAAGSDGTLRGGPITIAGHFQWDGSSIEATVIISSGGTGAISGPGNGKSLGGGGLGLPGQLKVDGAVSLVNLSGAGGSLGLGAGISRGLITVENGGTLSASGQNHLIGVSCCGGTNVPTLDNKGTINVTGGHLVMSGVLFHQLGHTDVAAGGEIDAQAPVTLGSGSSYAGSGQVLLDAGAFPSSMSGTLNLQAGSHLDLGPQACLAGSGTIAGPGTFDFTGGDLTAKVLIAAGARMRVAGSASLRAFGCGTADGQITNQGSLLLDQGKLSLGASGTIDNLTGGWLAMRGGTTLTTDVCCGQKKLLINSGTVKVEAPLADQGSGRPASIEAVPFAEHNSISVAAGQRLVLSSASVAFNPGSSLTGQMGRVVLNEPATVSGQLSIGLRTMLELASLGSVDGNFRMTGLGSLLWTGGAISGSVDIAKSIAVQLKGADNHDLLTQPGAKPSVLITQGPVVMMPGTTKVPDTLRIAGKAQLVNEDSLGANPFSWTVLD